MVSIKIQSVKINTLTELQKISLVIGRIEIRYHACMHAYSYAVLLLYTAGGTTDVLCVPVLFCTRADDGCVRWSVRCPLRALSAADCDGHFRGS